MLGDDLKEEPFSHGTSHSCRALTVLLGQNKYILSKN